MTLNRHYPSAKAHADRFGFQFGLAAVTRMTHIEGRYHVIAIDTPEHHLQVAVSPTGRSVRVWRDGEELK